MQVELPKVHEKWSSRAVFLLAAIGAAVGLGNIWKFPYTAGVSGGGAFVVIYIVAIAAVALPIVMAELLIGRRGRQSPVNSFRILAAEAKASSKWRFVGGMNVLAVYLILTFYSVIAGWAIAYIFKVGRGVFKGASADAVVAEFDRFLTTPGPMMIWHGIFMLITIVIVARGVQGGVEKAVKFLMPALFMMLIVLVGYAAVAGDFARAWEFLFAADFSKIDTNVILMAIGQAFFSVSVAMGLMIIYGAYLPENVSISRSAIWIAGADTLVALLAGLAIFPVVFANGLDPAEGPGLIFATLPIAFGQMPAGTVFGTMFFVLLVFAALTSSIAIMQPLVTWLEEHNVLGRSGAAVVVGFSAWLLGLATVFSFNIWSDWRPMAVLGFWRDKTVFDVIDYFASNILLPLGGVLIAVFVGWIMSRAATRDELNVPDDWRYRIWLLLIRYVAPVSISAVLLANFF